MRRLLGLLVLAASLEAQQPTIEVRKVGVLIDREGKGFTRAPFSMVPIANGQFALSETNVAPLIVNSSGGLVRRFVRGDGPGEFQVPGTQFRMAGDTLYATNGSSVNIYDQTGKFVRSVPTIGVYAMQVIPAPGGLVVSSQKFESPTKEVSLHVLGQDGKIVRSFLSDTGVDRRKWPPPPAYRIAPAADGAVWAAAMLHHRIEKWSLDGERKLVIDRRPSWFVISPTYGNTANVRAIHEADGLLWVMSSVPVSNAREIERKAIAEATNGATRGEVDARQIPFEKLETAFLEVYDARTGALIADLALGKYGITILDDRRFVVHSFTKDETSQLEIWEMKLKR